MSSQVEVEPAARPPRWRRNVARHPSGLLLAVQLLAVMVYPMIEGTAGGRAVFGVFGIAVLSLSLWVVNRSPTINWIAWLFAVPAVVLTLTANFGARADLLPVAYLLEAILYFYAAGGLIAYMLADHRVTSDELMAAGATFTLLAWAFAFAFMACQAWAPGSFSGLGDGNAPRTWTELLFLSFALLSATGMSDVMPVAPPARALSMLEMFAGVMYIAVVVSRVIALTTVRLRHRR